jgi:hypothetical protein
MGDLGRRDNPCGLDVCPIISYLWDIVLVLPGP